MKTCFKCQTEKPLSEFYRHPQMRDGHLNKCIECTKLDTAARVSTLVATSPEWRVKELRRCREKSAKARANGTASPVKPETSKRWRERNPEKYRAHCIVNNAVRTGKLEKKRCWCGKKAQAHHADYSKPLEVEWLCHEHHMQQHAKEHEREILS